MGWKREVERERAGGGERERVAGVGVRERGKLRGEGVKEKKGWSGERVGVEGKPGGCCFYRGCIILLPFPLIILNSKS